MRVEFVDIIKDCVLCTADIQFGLDTMIVKSCSNKTPSEAEQFLMKRCELPKTYDIDHKVYEMLGLSHREYEFDRASEAKVLYAMLKNFASENDDLRLYPVKTEFVSMIDLDSRFSNIYVWKCRKEEKA